MTRPKKVRQEAEITVWPSSHPDEIGSLEQADASVDSDELGSHFMSDLAEHGPGLRHAQWEAEAEEPYFDERMGEALLRSFGLKQMPKRTTTFPSPLEGKQLPKLTAPRMPLEFEHYITPSNDVELTKQVSADPAPHGKPRRRVRTSTQPSRRR